LALAAFAAAVPTEYKPAYKAEEYAYVSELKFFANIII
jgi:hypothetical protein